MTLERPMFPPRASRRGFLTVIAGGVAATVSHEPAMAFAGKPLEAPRLAWHFPLPVSAGAPERVPDPILAAIERHRRAYRDWMDSFGEDEIEALVPEPRRQSSFCGALHGDPDWQVAGDDPRWIAHIENGCRAGTEHNEASIALVSFETLSLAGVVALFEYVASHEAKDPEAWPDDLVDDDGKRQTWHYFLIAGLADALPGMVPTS